MGVCFSKKKEPAAAAPPPPPKNDPSHPISKETRSNTAAAVVRKEETKKEVKSSPQQASPAADASASAVAPVEKKPVFVVITQNTKKTASNSSTSTEEEEEKKEKSGEGDTELINTKNIAESSNVSVGLPKFEEARTASAVRTSNCTKEEVDAILIHCGRLSRSSSGKASNDTGGGGHRKYSGSKRSYDFDNEKGIRDDQEEDWDQKQLPRPSPRRRTPSRERSGSRERGSQRRVSRSPGRRSEGPTAAASSSSAGCDKPKQQPAKMVSVPAREKGVSNSAANVDNAGAKRFSANRRNASPRSRSPANASRVSNENAPVHHQPAQPQSLSRSSSRKAEQSPCRRNPMTEIDDNSLRGSSNNNKAQKSREGDEGLRKATQIQTTQKNGSMNNTSSISNCVRDQLMSCRGEKKQPEPEIVEEVKDPKGASKVSEIETLNHRPVTRIRSSRRSSRDLDQTLVPNPDSNNNTNAANYTSLLLEDIQNYHQQNVGFSLPACVSKACSILEAVADLNSSSSDQSDNDNGRFGRKGLSSKEPFVESEIVVKDDLMEPSLHKYISVRDLGGGGEMEPQESAGSNSFVGGQPWHSAWELNSVDSTDRYWTSQPNNGEEVEESSLPEAAACDFDARARTRLRSGGSSSSSLPSATGSSSKKSHRRQLHRSGSGVSGLSGNGKGGGRSYSLPVAAAATS